MRKSLTLAIAAMLAGCSAQSPAPGPKAEYTLTYASPYPPTHPFSRADIAWMAQVEKDSGGRIAFKPYWSGALISSDMSITEIRHGLADIGLITPIYTRGGVHLQRAQAGFYGGVKTMEDQVSIYDCLAARFPQLSNELPGLHVLAVQGGNFPGIMTRNRPVRTLADLKGLRLRAQTDSIDVLRALGADPVNMPMAEVYSALAKGVIDGVVAPADTIKSLHFSEVAHYFTTLRLSRGGYPARAMSDIAWRRLPPDLQNVLNAAKPKWEAQLNANNAKAEKAGIAFAKDHGVTIIPLPAADQTRFDALYNRFALDQARRLSAVGIDGEPVFRAAQALIASGQTRCTKDMPHD
ncbi:TRAP transporter substrate-binding protein [Novosphingobium humi]|uniref:TRAP transporter substrate-binding protein n=1 Tax=Novosphingobium humi TaxID=2282397 RepID=UPI0025B224A0|nr:TRAP transporter substrate-binding protein DctP [Novosphingobium humi]WJS97302.1 TRAP transporter substrate-binding protein DctP [Novosphingobium humi]